MSGEHRLVPLLDGLRFAESPRWRGDRLWFSDIFANRVMTVDEAGHTEIVVELTDGGRPSGLGFLPDGRLLIANLTEPTLLRLEPSGELVVHSDLTHLAVGGLNDMVVDDLGRAYVGSMGTHNNSEPRPLDGDGVIILVEPDGAARLVADQLDAPNGPALIAGGTTYVVAEFPANRLTAYDRSADGLLSSRRVWADLAPESADGIWADSEGAIWTASPWTRECRRVTEGGKVTDAIDVGEKMPLACALGGADGRTLFVLSLIGDTQAVLDRTCASVIETVRVHVPV
ncbi:SMP-30/gluconolactonase/LRE family protein [Pseudonocardia sp. GCM10023141]|uniref:SMP-30/gluconolactonase/LRE family protein n=1 Tax=Pseudonocardia sp. GCM10023141 TaxID=3252653 RepID=UPI0036197517